MTEHYSEERRTFLKAIAILGGSAASLTAGKTASSAATSLPAKTDPPHKRYTETEHIRKYYQTARS